MNGFNIQNNKGKLAEQLVFQHFKNKGKEIIDVSNDKRYQSIDVDFIYQEKYYLEVKLDNRSKDTGNVFIETKKDRKTGIYLSWFYNSKAHFIAFVDTDTHQMSIYNFAKLKEITENYSQRRYWDKVDGCYTYFYAIPVEDCVSALVF